MVILNHQLLFSELKEIRGIADSINDNRDNGGILAPFRPPTPRLTKSTTRRKQLLPESNTERDVLLVLT